MPKRPPLLKGRPFLWCGPKIFIIQKYFLQIEINFYNVKYGFKGAPKQNPVPLRSFPAVAILGPRQAGKTTLARTFSPIYYDLELDEDRLRLDIQWNELADSKEIIVLDEAQNFPALFPRIRSAIDKDRKRNGRFLILGSVSPGLMKEVLNSYGPFGPV